MKTLLIVYHSLTGGTRQMAEAAAGAATELGVDVRLLRAVAAGPGDVLAADGYIFAAPENLAALAGLMKDFFDRVSSSWPDQRTALWPHDLRWQRRYDECGPAGEPQSFCTSLVGAAMCPASHDGSPVNGFRVCDPR
jgi:menaquinone-dependent protoporphyrinogen IX oxidase